MEDRDYFMEAYDGALNLSQLVCDAKDKIRLMCATGKIDDADKLRISILNLGHEGLIERSLLELFNELTFDIILDARIKKEESKND